MSETPAKHLCRACGEPYPFPQPRSLATRDYCAACAVLDPSIRRVFQALLRRITRLEAQLSGGNGPARAPEGDAAAEEEA
ncbi:MAG: hypothetical protein QHJ73_07730 [Armatimonadota bacterium]|nr:hypothetical protein [Armatimonadota bacterium]